MTGLRKLELGSILALVVAVLGFAFWLGGLDQRLSAVDQRLTGLEERLSLTEVTQGKSGEGSASSESSDGTIGDPGPDRAARIALGELTDDTGRPIDRQAAPFKVHMSGTVSVSNSSNLFTCLVVDDQNREWVQPGCKKIIGNTYNGIFYLGEENRSDSIGKRYRLFAVVSQNSFDEYEILDRHRVLGTSEVVSVLRTR